MHQANLSTAMTVSFACPKCGKKFEVPASYAGRKATCKACGGPITVPTISDEPVAVATEAIHPRSIVRPEEHHSGEDERQSTSSTGLPQEHSPTLHAKVENPITPPGRLPAPKVPMRTRRLMSDAKQIAEAFGGFPLIQVRPLAGDPPEAYAVEYRIKGLRRGWFGRPRICDNHKVEIRLTSDYPRLAPHCKMLTRIFHPNIDETTICVGDHWTAGERLVDLVSRIGEMIAYQAYNIKSPLNGEAAMWADLHPNRLPIDARSLRPAERNLIANSLNAM